MHSNVIWKDSLNYLKYHQLPSNLTQTKMWIFPILDMSLSVYSSCSSKGMPLLYLNDYLLSFISRNICYFNSLKVFHQILLWLKNNAAFNQKHQTYLWKLNQKVQNAFLTVWMLISVLDFKNHIQDKMGCCYGKPQGAEDYTYRGETVPHNNPPNQ